MSSIINRKGVWYYQFYRDGKKRVKSMKTRDKSVAKRLKIQWDAKLEQIAMGLAPRKLPYNEALNRLFEAKKATLKPSGVRFYEGCIKHLSGLCKYVQELTPEMVAEYVTKRKNQGAAPATIYKEVSMLRRMIQFMIRCGALQKSPVTDWPTIKQIPKKADRIGFYSVKDIDLLKKNIAGTELEGPFLFALYTGCRKSELENTKVSDLNLAEGHVRLNVSKTEVDSDSSMRIVSIHPVLKAFFEKNPPPKSGTIFPQLKSHANDWLHKQLKKICQTIGVQYKRFHGLRHTAATYLLHAGVDLRTVMNLMGWKNLETAQRYLHHVQTMKAADEINKLTY